MDAQWPQFYWQHYLPQQQQQQQQQQTAHQGQASHQYTRIMTHSPSVHSIPFLFTASTHSLTFCQPPQPLLLPLQHPSSTARLTRLHQRRHQQSHFPNHHFKTPGIPQILTGTLTLYTAINFTAPYNPPNGHVASASPVFPPSMFSRGSSRTTVRQVIRPGLSATGSTVASSQHAA